MIVFLSRFGGRVRDIPSGVYGGHVLHPMLIVSGGREEVEAAQTLIVAAFEAAVEEERFYAP
ncbi:MAG: hypothetical protein WC455_18660 [Dehalococcoidia bacterium]